MKPWKLWVGVAPALFGASALGASVDLVSVEDTNSSRFTLRVTSLSQPVDFLAVRINPASQSVAAFQNPAWEDFADGAITTLINDQWSEFGSSKFLAAASGTFRSDLAWEMLFNQDPSQAFLLDVIFFSGDTSVTGATLNWTGSTSTSFFGPTDWVTTRSQVEDAFMIPLPTSLAMGLMGLAGMASSRRRR